VWICDAYLRRGRYDAPAIHSKSGAGGRYWGWRGLNPSGCIAILAGMAVAAMTMKSPLYDGPIATALGGTDISWIVGFPVAALMYCVMVFLLERQPAAAHEAVCIDN
jgi:cytosine/uracil/thiamine/allantoin permease